MDNIPFYIYGVSLGDVVLASEVDGRLVFHEVRSSGGHSTYRVLIADAAGVESAGFKQRWEVLQRLGCSNEVARKRWVSIDVPMESDVFAVYELLEAGELDAVWSFEEAHCGHPIP